MTQVSPRYKSDSVLFYPLQTQNGQPRGLLADTDHSPLGSCEGRDFTRPRMMGSRAMEGNQWSWVATI